MQEGNCLRYVAWVQTPSKQPATDAPRRWLELGPVHRLPTAALQAPHQHCRAPRATVASAAFQSSLSAPHTVIPEVHRPEPSPLALAEAGSGPVQPAWHAPRTPPPARCLATLAAQLSPRPREAERPARLPRCTCEQGAGHAIGEPKVMAMRLERVRPTERGPRRVEASHLVVCRNSSHLHGQPTFRL